MSRKIYYDDQAGWGPEDYGGLWRFLDRLFLPQYRHYYADEIANLDLQRMSEDTLYLMRHMLILKGSFEELMEEFENLRPLKDVPDSGRTLILSRRPTFIYDYLTEREIFL